MRRVGLSIVTLLILASCQSQPAVVSDVHTGNQTIYGTGLAAYSGGFDTLRARPFFSSAKGFGIETTYNNYGWKFLREAYSHGKRLNYVKVSDTATMCAGAGGCITVESGYILMSPLEFEAAAKSGLSFALIGSAGRVEGSVPAAAFRSVLDLQRKG